MIYGIFLANIGREWLASSGATGSYKSRGQGLDRTVERKGKGWLLRYFAAS